MPSSKSRREIAEISAFYSINIVEEGEVVSSQLHCLVFVGSRRRLLAPSKQVCDGFRAPCRYR